MVSIFRIPACSKQATVSKSTPSLEGPREKAPISNYVNSTTPRKEVAAPKLTVSTGMGSPNIASPRNVPGNMVGNLSGSVGSPRIQSSPRTIESRNIHSPRANIGRPILKDGAAKGSFGVNKVNLQPSPASTVRTGITSPTWSYKPDLQEGFEKMGEWQSDLMILGEPTSDSQSRQMSLMSSQIHSLTRELSTTQNQVRSLSKRVGIQHVHEGSEHDKSAVESHVQAAVDESLSALRVEWETQACNHSRQMSLLDSQIHSLTREFGDLRKNMSLSSKADDALAMNPTMEVSEAKLEKMLREQDKLREDMKAALSESNTALRLELTEYGWKNDKIRAAVEEVERALESALDQWKLESSLKEDLQQRQQHQSPKTKEMKLKTEDKMGTGAQVPKGVSEGRHGHHPFPSLLAAQYGDGSLRDMSNTLTKATQQVDILEKSVEHLQHEVQQCKEARIGKEQDQAVSELKRDMKAAVEEHQMFYATSLSALRNELQQELAEVKSSTAFNDNKMHELMKDVSAQADTLTMALKQEPTWVEKMCADLRMENSKVLKEAQTALHAELVAQTGASMSELEKQLRFDVKRTADDTDACNRLLNAMGSKQSVRLVSFEQRLMALESAAAGGTMATASSQMEELDSINTKIHDMERQLKQSIDSLHPLPAKGNGEPPVQDGPPGKRGTAASGEGWAADGTLLASIDGRVAHLETFFTEISGKHAQAVDGVHAKVCEALIMFSQQRGSYDNNKAIVDQRLSALDKAVAEAAETYANALSACRADLGKEAQSLVHAERAARETFEKTVIDYINDARQQHRTIESRLWQVTSNMLSQAVARSPQTKTRSTLS